VHQGIVSLLATWLCLASVAVVAPRPLPANAQSAADDILSRERVQHDPEIPVLGNPQGDLTIVEYFDYQCPYCKKVAPELQNVVRDDGRIRLVLKDWPIFGDASVYAARLALAAKYQDRYREAHDALMAARQKLTEASVQETLSRAGIDVARASRDLAAHPDAIDALLARNHAQALAFGFQGTPAFIIGHFRVPGMLDAAMFKRAVEDARAAQKRE
jgi:protein-disulfide isomerase